AHRRVDAAHRAPAVLRRARPRSARLMPPALEAARARSAARIAADVRTLSRPPFTAAPPAVCRYAYTPEWTRTVRWVADRLAALGFMVSDAPLGTLVARNVPAGARSVGVGSHLDSVRRGGAWDG